MEQHNLDGIIIANNIRAERNRANLSQEDVAKLLGVSRETYSSYEKDARVIRATTLYNLSQILQCSINAFFIQ